VDNLFNRVQVTRGPAPQLALMGYHLYRAPVDSTDLSSQSALSIVSFYYSTFETALTAVDNAIFYQNPTMSGRGAGLYTCNEGQGCAFDTPLIAYPSATPIQAIHADAKSVYFASGNIVHRIPRAGYPDGGTSGNDASLDAPVFANVGAAVRYLDATDPSHLVVVTVDGTATGQVRFVPKAGGPPVSCPTKLTDPQAFTSDADEIFVSDTSGVFAIHR
jgi:hypothetical protein